MAFQEILARLESPRLTEFAEAWRVARGTTLVPRWSDLDIVRMKNCLSYLWAWEYDRDTDIFRGKLAGEAIQDVLGRGFRGALAHEYCAGRLKGVFLERCRRIILGEVAMVTTGRVSTSTRRTESFIAADSVSSNRKRLGETP